MSEPDLGGGAPRLTEHQVKTIMLLHELGMMQTSLAKMFNVSTIAIWNIIHGRTWKHLTTSKE